MHDALILGAGISGLAAAYQLRKMGLEPQLLEAEKGPGGTMGNREGMGFRFETGPNTLFRSPLLEELCIAAGCAGDLQPAAAASKKRYLVHGGQLQALPSSALTLLRTPLLSLRGRLRLLAEPLQRRGTKSEESVRAFLSRRLGSEAAVNFADALVYGIYAGDADELTLSEAYPRLFDLEQRWGSLLRGMVKTAKGAPRRQLVGFRGGFGHLARRLAEPLQVRYGCLANTIEHSGEGFLVTSASGEQFSSRRLVTALPAAASARLLRPLGAKWPTPLHASVATLGLGFAAGTVGHPLDGFGFLAPAKEKRSVLGCLFSSSLFPDTAPSGATALTVIVGGRARPELLELDDNTLCQRVVADLRPLLELSAEPVFSTITRWRPGIPQPTTGQENIRRGVAAVEGAHPGLRVLGNWLHGVSIADCLQAATTVGDVLDKASR